MKADKPVILMILDGCGIDLPGPGNAITQAKTFFLDQLFENYPHTSLKCSGEHVGLPEGVMGNSEVGHLNIGAGRIVYQDMLRINKAINDKSFFQNKAFNRLISQIKKRGSSLHLMGLVSDGSVHSHINHLFALLDMAKQNGISKTYVHAILDGRDTPPDSGKKYISKLKNYINRIEYGAIATICGRFYAMDRDNRWNRIEKAFNLFTLGKGRSEKDPIQAVKNAYDQEETDEFIHPIVLTDSNNMPLGTVQDGDGIIFFNFRADRAREITQVFVDKSFDSFKIERLPELCGYVCMTMYDKSFNLPLAFEPVHHTGILGEVISKNGLRQLRIAETEKYAHVTYFFNGGEEKAFPLEDRKLIPSPREVATYDLKPEMSAYKVAEEVVKQIESDKYDLIVLNFANMDMVGHTGILSAAIKACETVDKCVEKVISALKSKGGIALITADHGNSEMMLNNEGKPHTAHTTNKVPLIMVNNNQKQIKLKQGILGDLGPTILDLMNIQKPEEMTGKSLIERKE
ncbi:2,3-bisphosphoglycerate-independent phosphoglycerate mutase [Candidatus Magnetomoraceae bacterium gMMP-15]